MDIAYHENVPRDKLESMAGYPVDGYTWRVWNPLRLDWDCDIYLAPRGNTSDGCWEALIQHEEKHCTNGSYHPSTPEGSRIDCY